MVYTYNAHSVVHCFLRSVQLEPLESCEYHDDDMTEVERRHETTFALYEGPSGQRRVLRQEASLPFGIFVYVGLNVHLLHGSREAPAAGLLYIYRHISTL